ncbi:MAG: hypothetical protein EAX96_18385 [Candidatus Lokiarchaeota archaeon]|nr:hypothetical protein [Candidatus Lokiarchaeota archaeon]
MHDKIKIKISIYVNLIVFGVIFGSLWIAPISYLIYTIILVERLLGYVPLFYYQMIVINSFCNPFFYLMIITFIAMRILNKSQEENIKLFFNHLFPRDKQDRHKLDGKAIFFEIGFLSALLINIFAIILMVYSNSTENIISNIIIILIVTIIFEISLVIYMRAKEQENFFIL